MDLGVSAYMVEKENESRNIQGAWDPKLPSQVNERMILERQRSFWDELEKQEIAKKIKRRMNEPEK